MSAPSDVGESIDAMLAFVEAVRRLAFEMPAPNEYTPRFVLMCIAADARLRRARFDLTELRWKYEAACDQIEGLQRDHDEAAALVTCEQWSGAERRAKPTHD